MGFVRWLATATCKNGPTINHHQHVSYHMSTINSNGMKDVLNKHAGQLNADATTTTYTR